MFLRLVRKSRRLAKWGWVGFLYSTGLLYLAKRLIGKRNGILVLTFHRVLPANKFPLTGSPRGMVMRQETFEDLTSYVARHYPTVPLNDSEPEWNIAKSQPRLAFTLDDGWIDSARVTFPIAQKYRIPLTIFICPERVGKELPFWPERVVGLWREATKSPAKRRKIAELMAGANAKGKIAGLADPGDAFVESLLEFLKKPASEKRDALVEQIEQIVTENPRNGADHTVDATMSWNDIFELERGGVTFGSHTMSHEILPHISAETAQLQLAESKKAIEAKLGRKCSLFAYPNGDYSFSTRDLVERCGYCRAFVDRAGTWIQASDPYLIPRSNIWEGIVAGRKGTFSPMLFEYEVFWKSFWAKTHTLREKVGASSGRSTKEGTTSAGHTNPRRESLASGRRNS